MLITLDSSLHKPLYVQIREQIRGRILSGAVAVGDRLDPSRELAKRLGVHRTTVSNAYADLEAEGLIHGTVGRGTFVSPFVATLRETPPARQRPGNDFYWDSFFAPDQQDDSLGRLMASALEPGLISFATAHASAELCPVDLIRRAMEAALRREGARLMQYGSTDGYAPLKQYLQARLRRDGIPLELDELLITSGCQQSLDLLRRILVAPGDAVACENPTYPGLWHVFATPGARLIGIPVGPEGMDLEFLEAMLEQNKVKLILTSPNFQNPTGSTMPLAARKRLLELAARFQAPIAEDDIYGVLRYTGRELPPLKALDTTGQVVYLNSFSKIGFPGFRVGWIAASRRVIDRLRSAKQRADLHTNLLGQAVLDEFARRGWLDKLLRKTRKFYEHKLSVLRRAVEETFPPEVQVKYPDGGMAAWVELPANLDAGELLVKARERRVVFAPARFFYFQNPRHNAFRLCFTAVPDEQLAKGVRILGELLRSEIRRGKTGRKAVSVGSGVALV
ncbi:MAG: PLP-dependent aminotransferase family protein [Acidobacteriia bacterium]|nr:PLP-dependent aminotransferase family protein [Terriglobia bacterium]